MRKELNAKYSEVCFETANACSAIKTRLPLKKVKTGKLIIKVKVFYLFFLLNENNSFSSFFMNNKKYIILICSVDQTLKNNRELLGSKFKE